MSVTPRVGAPELASAQASPETTVNEQCRQTEQMASLGIVQDRDLTAPPGSCSDGDAYLVAASPTGAWSGKAGKIAYAVGPSASNGWNFITIIEGHFLWVVDEAKLIRYHLSTWAEFAPNPQPPAVSTQSGTSYTAVLADANTYIRFTSASAVSFTIPANASVAFATGTEIHGIQAGAGSLLLVADTGVTLNSYGADLSLAGQYAGFTAKKVATNTWDVVGKFA